MEENNQVYEIALTDIIPNRFQPRLAFDEKELNELAQSIKTHGIIQPLVLRKAGDKYEIIAGERRYKASSIAGLTKVPAIIVQADDAKSAELAVVENVQRKNLTAIEEAVSYKKLMDKGMTQEEIAKTVGVAQPTIANKIRLLGLDEEVQKALLENRISERHARSLLTIPEKATQIQLLHKIIEQRLTVKQTDDEINKLLGRNTAQVMPQPVQDVFNLNVDNIKQNAMDIKKPAAPANVADLLKPQSAPVPPEDTTSSDESGTTKKIELERVEANVDMGDIVSPIASIEINPTPEVVSTSVRPPEQVIDQNSSVLQYQTPAPLSQPVVTPVVEPVSVPIQPTVEPVSQQAEVLDFGSFEAVTPVSVQQPVVTPVVEPASVPKAPVSIPTPVQETSIPLENPANKPTVYNVSSDAPVERKISTAIEMARNLPKEIKNQGFSVNFEEFDFEDMYQIVIKIMKD